MPEHYWLGAWHRNDRGMGSSPTVGATWMKCHMPEHYWLGPRLRNGKNVGSMAFSRRSVFYHIQKHSYTIGAACDQDSGGV